ncbi:MAG: hypothetical protein KAT65_26840 [Methanophagales archaeon]|jgi:Asp-tRNA(Asn)/Glu-tRNA(Gln) amidotransferase C subunit|nr:hypothetical protein [Methanophagales archaeon]
MLRKEELEHIGWLSWIELNETGHTLFEQRLSSILDSFTVLGEFDTEGA